jgi:hypothetical protein
MEPEHPIEKLLRAFAKKRRDQAGGAVELHSVARQALHKEISRRAQEKSEKGRFSGLFSGFRPRLAFAVCCLAVVSVGAWLLLPIVSGNKPATLSSENRKLALSMDRSKEMPVAPPPVSVAQPTVSTPPDNPPKTIANNSAPAEPKPDRTPALPDAEMFKRLEGAKNEGTQRPSTEGIPGSATAPVAVARPSGPATKFDSFTDTRMSHKVAGETSFASTPPTVATQPAAAPATLAGNASDVVTVREAEKMPVGAASGAASSYSAAKDQAAIPSVSQQFRRVDAPATRQRAAGALDGSAPVLASFQVEQNGNEMRVVDSDGSVYIGSVQVAPGNPSPDAASAFQNKPSPGSTAARLPQQAFQNRFFRVAGTNRNLHQNVVFSGNLIPLTNDLNGPTNSYGFGGGGGFGGRRAAQETPALSPSLLLNSRISGKATIGNQKEIDVNAAPAR